MRFGLISLIVAGAVAVSAQAPVFRTSVELVSVDVAVRRGGRAVADLRASDFEVRDNGQIQSIIDVSAESWPIDLTVVADLSSSVEGSLLVSLKRAVDRVGTGLRPADRVHVVGFNQIIRENGGTAAVPVPLSSMLGPPGGGTSLFDALVASSIRERESGFRPMLIAFTDGRDTTSFLSQRVVVDVARRADTAIFVVAVTGSNDPTLVAPHADLFSTITDLTGGMLTVIARDDDLSGAFLRAFEEFRSSYVLRYEPQGAPRDGWHDLAVRVTRPGRFDVRARRGYQADRLPLQSSP